MKRWLAGKGLTIDRLERMAQLCGLVLGDLAREAEECPGDLAHELTLAQEKALSTNIFLSFLFMALLGGVPAEEVAADFNVPAAANVNLTMYLEQKGIYGFLEESGYEVSKSHKLKD